VDNVVPAPLSPRFANRIRLASTRKAGSTLNDINQRFEAFPDPIGNWMVWDCQNDDFAMIGTQRMWMLTEQRAKSACVTLNALLGSIREPAAMLL
jgi:hypothetical protein